jgi:hypothetical protein
MTRYRIKAAAKIGENLYWHSRAHAARINELAVVGVVAKSSAPRWGREPLGPDQPTINKLFAD